jgi:hypothetical protein
MRLPIPDSGEPNLTTEMPPQSSREAVLAWTLGVRKREKMPLAERLEARPELFEKAEKLYAYFRGW